MQRLAVKSQEFPEHTYSSSVTHHAEAARAHTVQSAAIELPRGFGSDGSTHPEPPWPHRCPAHLRFQQVRRQLISPPVSDVIPAQILVLSATGIHLLNKLPKESGAIQSVFAITEL